MNLTLKNTHYSNILEEMQSMHTLQRDQRIILLQNLSYEEDLLQGTGNVLQLRNCGVSNLQVIYQIWLGIFYQRICSTYGDD